MGMIKRLGLIVRGSCIPRFYPNAQTRTEPESSKISWRLCGLDGSYGAAEAGGFEKEAQPETGLQLLLSPATCDNLNSWDISGKLFKPHGSADGSSMTQHGKTSVLALC